MGNGQAMQQCERCGQYNPLQAQCPCGWMPVFTRTVDTELAAAKARIAELDRAESWARDCCSALERDNEQLRMALQSVTPQVIDWVKCGAVTNGRPDNEWRPVVESLSRSAALLNKE